MSDTLVPILLVLIVFATAWALTGVLRRYAIRRSVIDIPNERSSHVIPTPRGGGLSVAIVFTLALVFMSLAGLIEKAMFIALAVGGVFVAAIGFLGRPCGPVENAASDSAASGCDLGHDVAR